MNNPPVFKPHPYILRSEYIAELLAELGRMDEFIQSLPADNSAAKARAMALDSRERLRRELREVGRAA